jgi:serine/threonine protein kinase
MKETPTPESLRPGDVVGSWRIEGYAGRGSYGLVFRARRVGVPHSPPVALKMAAFANDLRFLREGDVLSRFRHPSIPQLLHRDWWIAGPHAAHPYLVLEWIRGRPMYQWALVHRPTVRQVLHALGQVAGALDVLHQGECLHRDVKGDNILVERGGRAVLMDYGSCTWAGAPPLTETLMPPNTPEYRSPEALRFQWSHWRMQEARYETRPADDVYALGVTAYRLVTRVYPPPGTAPEEFKQQLQAPSPRRLPPRELNGRVVPQLAVLIDRMLAEEPEARGLARNAAHAAGAAAAGSGPELDGPLWDPKSMRAEYESVSFRLIPPSSSEPPAAKARPVPVPVRIEPRASFRTSQARLLFATMVLALVVIWWMGPTSRKQMPEVVQGASLEAEEAPDSGATGLGDGGVTARVEPQEEPTLAKTVGKQMPKQPLPGQFRAPCGRGEVEIRGGCWARWTTLTPPCGEKAYEWNGACYWPLLKGEQRVPTSEDPQ